MQIDMSGLGELRGALLETFAIGQRVKEVQFTIEEGSVLGCSRDGPFGLPQATGSQPSN